MPRMARIFEIIEPMSNLERLERLRESEEHAENARSDSVRADRTGGLDEPAPAADDRVPARGKSVLREQLGYRRLRFNDDQRRRVGAERKRRLCTLRCRVLSHLRPSCRRLFDSQQHRETDGYMLEP